MSVDRYTHFWHLTSAGWVRGAEGMYLSEAQSKEKTPNNRLLTLEYEEHQTSQYSKPDYYMRLTYIDSRQYADVVRAILTYGLYPDHGAGQDEKQAASNNKSMITHYGQDMTLANLINKCPLSKVKA